MKIPDRVESGEMNLCDILTSSMALPTQLRDRYSFIGECTSPHLARQCAVVIRITRYLNPIRQCYRRQSVAFALAG